jgi:hypothetical protein
MARPDFSSLLWPNNRHLARDSLRDGFIQGRDKASKGFGRLIWNAQYDDGEAAPRNHLLVGHILIESHEDIEVPFDRIEQRAVREIIEPREMGRFNRGADEMSPEPMRDASVEQNPDHALVRLFGRKRDSLVRRLDNRDGMRARNTGKVVQKLFERVTGLEIVEQGFYGHAPPREARLAAEPVGRDGD